MTFFLPIYNCAEGYGFTEPRDSNDGISPRAKLEDFSFHYIPKFSQPNVRFPRGTQ